MRPARCYLLFSLIFISLKTTFAQCPITVNAGPDQYVCSVGSTATLGGSISGNFLGFVWAPATGLNDPMSLNPTATVTGFATYTLTGFAEDPSAPNQVVNPAFEAGNTGFSSDFAYSNNLLFPGSYFITTSPAVINSNFPPCDDHTSGNGTGNMMIVNGTALPADVWCQSISVSPNTYYVMSAWITSAPLSPPTMQFSVNGTLVGNPFASSGGGCFWEQFSAAWFSGSSTSALVCVTDQSTSGNGLFGDFFALDDIYFAEACSMSDDVTVDVAEADASAPLLVVLPCNALPGGIQLDGSASSSGPNIGYQWTTSNGNIVSGANSTMPTVDMEGLYTLTVTFDNGQTICTDETTVEVLPDPNFVIANASAPESITCTSPSVIIDGGGSSAGPSIEYAWSPLAGIIEGETTAFPEVVIAGTFTLTVTNTDSGCTATASVTVSENTTSPTAAANAPGQLTCTTNSLILNGSGSSTGGGISYLWTTSGTGNIVSGETTLNDCLVNAPGIYQLTVTNTANGCAASATAVVTAASGLPTALATTTDTIDCKDQTGLVSGIGSTTGMGIAFLWTTTNGHIVSGADQITAVVDSGGIYVLTVSNTANGCSATDTVFVFENTIRPVAVAAPSAPFDCLTDQLQLDGTGSSTDSVFTHIWTTANGILLNGETSLFPLIGAPGSYVIAVADTTNGCIAFDTVIVLADTLPPVASAGAPVSIGCLASPETLDGSGSSTGPDFAYLWTTAGGNISEGETTLQPTVTAAGLYFITVSSLLNGCMATDSVAVIGDGNAPDVGATVNGQLDCSTTQITIDATASDSGPDILITWTTPDGNIFSGANSLQPIVDDGGTYLLTLTDTSNNCSASTSVMVMQDTLFPQITIAPPGLAGCGQNEIPLDASASSQGVVFSQNWTTPNGVFVSGEMTLTPVVATAGTYFLTIMNLENGCASTDSVVVAALPGLPTADAGNALVLDCTNPMVQLDGTGSSQGIQFSYNWTHTTTTGAVGNGVVAGPDSLTPTINAPGTYLLTVTDDDSGCSATASVTVTADADVPQIDAGPAPVLNCLIEETTLSATSAPNPDIDLHWTTQSGNILFGETTLQPLVDAPGTYFLTATNTANGCTAVDSVSVFEIILPPLADAGDPFTLPCGVPSAALNGSGTGISPTISFAWTTPNGNIIGPAGSQNIDINAPGTYILTVTDESTGCQATDTVTINADGPVAVAGQPGSITCLADSLTLDGTGSDTGPGITYQWTTSTGNILSGATTLQPTVDAPGTYLLAVTNTATNCQTLASVQVFDQTTPPVVSITDVPVLTCTSPIGSIPATTNAGDPSWLWTTTNGHFVFGEMTPAPTIDSAGIYTLTVTDAVNGCTATASATVTADNQEPIAVATTPGALGCGQNTLTLDGTGSSAGLGFQYLWTTPTGNITAGATTLQPIVSAAGQYVLTVENTTNGCTATATVMVEDEGPAPVISIAPPGLLTCMTTALTLDASASTTGPGYQFLWTTTDGNIVSGATTLQPVVDASGTYSLSIFHPQTGCSAADLMVVLENTTPPQATAGDDLVLGCNGEEIEIQGSLLSPLNALFDWAFEPLPGVSGDPFLSGQQTSTPWVNLPGTYTLTVTDPLNGCVFSETMSVTATGILDFAYSVEQPDCLVPTGSIAITDVQGGNAPFMYAVNGVDFAAQTFFDALPPGNYPVTVQDADGCEQAAHIQIVGFQPFEIILSATVSAPLGAAVPLAAQVTLEPSAIGSIVWSPAAGLSCTDCLSPVATPTVETTYQIEVTDTNGCTALATTTILIETTEADIFVPNVFSPNDDGINDRLLVFANGQLVERVVQFRLFDRWGGAVFEAFDFPPNDFQYGWDGTNRGDRMGSAVFAWLAEVLLVDGSRRMLEGEVVLVR